MKTNIWIASASTGWGHIQAARNIQEAIGRLAPSSDVQQIDVFDHLPPGLKSLTRYVWQFSSLSASNLYSSFYQHCTGSSGVHHVLDRVVRMTSKRMAAQFDHAPDIFVATHSFAACIGSKLKEEFGCKLLVVATDFVVHSLHMRHNIDMLCVPPTCEYTNQLSLDANRERILVTGIPIASDFAVQKDPEQLRKRMGLSEDLATVLVSFGGSGLRAELHLQQFRALLDLDLPLQFIVLAGHNLRFASAARRLLGCNRRFRVYDFVEGVSEFYSAADIFIGKAGGLSVSEALAVGLPIIIIDTLPGQEESNLRMLATNGLGSFASNTYQIQDRLKVLLGEVKKSGTKRESHHLARPLSSNAVADCLVSLGA